MQDREWPRSRYWLCHFIQNRHERVTIPWKAAAPAPDAMKTSVANWLRWISETNAPARARLIDWAVRDCASDPAYVQSIRLFIREEQHHTEIIGRYLALRETPGRAGGFNRAAVRAIIKPLGMRFELSVLTLSEIAVITMNRLLLEKSNHDAALSALLTQVIHDHQCHLAFHSERLTTEFADFNFLRRNLRRLRLRTMFAVAIKGLTLHHRPLLRALNCTPRQFSQRCWAGFETVLERMVPYRREALLARLLDQRENRYAKAISPLA
jgi:hypothetical protein